MGILKCVTVLVAIVFMCNLAHGKEFVPVYMWSTQRINEKVPALHRTGEESFKDDLLEYRKDNTKICFFAEPNLSPEDFTLRDSSGELVFQNLAKFKSSTKTSYLPYVQNPLNAIKHLESVVVEVSADDINDDFKFPETEMLLINLNDAKDDEDRVDLLKRHDAIINDVFNKLRAKHENVLGVYTARHTSWVGSEDILHNRKTRELLEVAAATNTTSYFFTAQNAIVYFTNATIQTKETKEIKVDEVTTTFDNKSVIVNFVAKNTVSVSMNFTKDISVGYYQLIVPVKATYAGTTYSLYSQADIYAPRNFSYHCGDQNFTDGNSKEGNFSVFFKNFQIQVYFAENLVSTNTTFNDAYDCVGFTSIPIWSGLFVTTILLIIMSLGITMMMDIKTMDRFDDAKGKTITINTSE